MAVTWLGLAAAAALVGGLLLLRHSQVLQRVIDRGGPDRFRVDVDDVETQLNWARLLIPLAVTLATTALLVDLTRHRRSTTPAAPTEPEPTVTGPWPRPDGSPAMPRPRRDAVTVPCISAASCRDHEQWGPAPDVEVILIGSEETGKLPPTGVALWFAGSEPYGVVITSINEIRLEGRVRFDPAWRGFLRHPGRPAGWTTR